MTGYDLNAGAPVVLLPTGGGSLPLYVFAEVLEVPIVTLPIANHDDNQHAVDENLRVPLERPGPWTVQRVYELFPRLAQRRANKGRQLSGGEQEMLAIARALLLNPKLLCLDEPSQGLAPIIVQEVFRVVSQMRDQGMSVLLIEQNVRAAVAVADRAYVLDDGRVVYEGAAADFAQDEERVRALAGASAEKWDVAD